MPRHTLHSSLPLAFSLACAFWCEASRADEAPQQITVTGRINGATLEVAGFGDVPLERAPFAASVLDASQLQEAGARNFTDLTRLDAAISDAYNAEGYWQSLTVRGFVIDNRFNYRRDGLPINAETVIPLDNKSALQVLKGTSGLQAGTSAPGGLVDFIVKRPLAHELTRAVVEWRDSGSLAVDADFSRRFDDGRFGIRVNAAYERLAPPVRDDKGERHLASVAGDWRVADGTLVEAEFESSLQSQPSVPAFSLLGPVLPDARSVDPRINLNDQPWSLPVVFAGHTGSLRLQQRLGDDWRLTAHAMAQRLVTQDRVAFPFGCSAEDDFTRYCSDGSFDFYDYRSENEHRDSDALQLQLEGHARTGGITHQIETGVLLTRFRMRSLGQAYNFVGTGTVDGLSVVPPDPTLAYPNTNRDERSTELFLRDAMQLVPGWGLWAGLRHTRLHRDAVGTDGSAPTSYDQGFTTPWLALTRELAPRTLLYASWGQGIESFVAPNLPLYTNAGRPLPTLKSRQAEIGLKHGSASVDASAALFDIVRPEQSDIGSCDEVATCTSQIDGRSHHRGAELLLSWHAGPWLLHGSGLWLDATREGSADPNLEGLRPTNVANRTLRAELEHRDALLPGLALHAALVYEGDRMVVPDNSVRIPSWTRIDLGARYVQPLGRTTLTWRLGIDNAADRRAWKEAPYQYGHAYLFPMAPRTIRLSLQADI